MPFSDTPTPIVATLLFLPLGLGLIQQSLTEPRARSWHTKLHKSPYRPPPFVFPIAWIWSYITMGYASLLVYQTASTPPVVLAAALYALHLVLLNSWGFCFFTFRRMDIALNVMLCLDLTVALLLIFVAAIKPFAAGMCLPYFCWLLELTYLNVYMFRHNGDLRMLTETKEQIVQRHARGIMEVGDVDEYKED